MYVSSTAKGWKFYPNGELTSWLATILWLPADKRLESSGQRKVT